MASIRNRLLWSVGVGVVLLISASGLLLYALLHAALEHDFDEALRSKARALSVLVEQDGQRIETDLGQQVIPEFLPGARAEYYQVWADESVVIARSASLGDAQLSPDATPIGGIHVRDIRLPDGRHGRQVSTSFHPYNEARLQPGTRRATLVLARSTAELSRSLARLRKILSITGVALALLTVSLLLGVVSFGLAPLKKMAARIATIGHTDLSVRLAPGTASTELAPVVDHINDLLQRLEDAFSRERALSADVAHELRNPLSGLATSIEVALTRDREPAEYRAVLASCLEISQTTSRMVESLLALARADSGHLDVQTERVSITPLLEEALAGVTAQLTERALVVDLDLAPDLIVCADADKLAMILNNLVDNALSYADEGGQLHVHSERSADGCSLTLRNTGCTLQASDALHVFERFWRGDRARAVGSHAGLGLTLCLRLARMMKGELEVQIAEGCFVATLTLPAAPESA